MWGICGRAMLCGAYVGELCCVGHMWESYAVWGICRRAMLCGAYVGELCCVGHM